MHTYIHTHIHTYIQIGSINKATDDALRNSSKNQTTVAAMQEELQHYKSQVKLWQEKSKALEGVYVCMYVRMYVYETRSSCVFTIFTHVYMYIYERKSKALEVVYVHACMYVSMYVYEASCCNFITDLNAKTMHTYIHTYIHVYMHTFIRTHIHTHIHTYIHTHTHIHT